MAAVMPPLPGREGPGVNMVREIRPIRPLRHPYRQAPTHPQPLPVREGNKSAA